MKPWMLFIQVKEQTLTTQEQESLQTLCDRMQTLGWKINRITERNLLEGLCREQTVAIVQESFWCDFLKERDIAVVGWESENAKETLPSKYILQGLEGVDEAYLQKAYYRLRGIPLEILETKRCRLREQTVEDLEELYEIYQQPHMTDYIEPLYEWNEEVVYQKAYIEHVYGLYGYGLWSIIEKESKRLIGRAGIETRESCQENEVEMGYAISSDYQHQGYATEVCQGILDYVDEHMPQNTVICRVHRDNKYSRKLLEKIGFTLRGETNLSQTNEIVYERVPL